MIIVSFNSAILAKVVVDKIVSINITGQVGCCGNKMSIIIKTPFHK